MREFISSDIIRNILEQTLMIFGTVKEDILEILDERLGTFCYEMMAMVGDLSLTFREFRASRAPEFFGKKDPIASRRWLVDVANSLCTSYFHEGEKVILDHVF